MLKGIIGQSVNRGASVDFKLVSLQRGVSYAERHGVDREWQLRLELHSASADASGHPTHPGSSYISLVSLEPCDAWSWSDFSGISWPWRSLEFLSIWHQDFLSLCSPLKSFPAKHQTRMNHLPLKVSLGRFYRAQLEENEQKIILNLWIFTLSTQQLPF